jgi:hypothetical protein
MARKKQTVGERSDARATAIIERAGWSLTTTPHRFVAFKTIHEREDESTTRLFESDYTLVGLAAAVERREKEEAR